MSSHGSPGAGAARGAGSAVLRMRAAAVNAAGGPARARVALTLAAVLAVNGADVGTVSATTGDLERAFGVGNTQIGLLLTVVSLTAAAFTLPAGVLTDRVRRTWLLSGSIAAWAVATVVSGAATSYWWLLVARVALGVVTATAGPAVASLTGDYFPAADRARIYGLITGGDLAGSGLGYLVSGDLSSLTTWRAAFWWLAVPSLVLAWLVWRLPEPARGGASHIASGATEIPAERDVRVAGDQDTKTGTGHQRNDPGGREPGFARQAVGHAGASPREDLVLREDPADRPVWWAVRYVLRVRTNVVIIIASALGYFYFAGLRSFAIIFSTGHYGISKPTATSLILVIGGGALIGVFVGGRGADRLLHRGHLRARVILPAASLLALPVVLAPAIATRSVSVALPLLIVGAFLLGAPNPALDAARLDIMPSGLWGRAEAVRTVLRSGGEAAAPLLFGYVSQYVFGGPGSVSGDGSSGAPAGNAADLEYTFLLFLGALLIAGLLALAGLRTYPRDVATAAASADAIGRAAGNSGRQRPPDTGPTGQCPDHGGNRRSAAGRLRRSPGALYYPGDEIGAHDASA